MANNFINPYEAQIPPPGGWKVNAISSEPAKVLEELRYDYVGFNMGEALYCGLDSITGLVLVKDHLAGQESDGTQSIYNRRNNVFVRKEHWLDKLETLLIGKPGLLIFCRPTNYAGAYERWDQPELMQMCDEDPRCTRLASYLNRTGPHSAHPNHLRLYMFLGKHENPDQMENK